MTKYKYDMRIGHYIPVLSSHNFLSEGLVAGPVEGEKQLEQLEEKPAPTLANLETEEIAQMRHDMQIKLLNALKLIQTAENNINLINSKIANLQTDKVEQSKLTDLQKVLLLAQLDLIKKKEAYNKIETEESKKIINALAKLIESKVINKSSDIPSKYRYLFEGSKSVNESNILNAKVYVDKLIKDDGMERIKGMIDFKKAFKDSELLYGKDKEGGYFAVCVDQADFNKLADTLEEVGYLRDDILAVTLPQIFDRTNLTK